MARAEPALHSINLIFLSAEIDHGSSHETPQGRLLLDFINPGHENISQNFVENVRKGIIALFFLIVASC